MPKVKTKIWITSVIAVIAAMAAFFAMLYFNSLHMLLGKWTIAAVLAGPVLALAVAVYAAFGIFKKGENLFFLPTILAIVGCLLAFLLVNGASLSKIEADFLKHEADFSKAVTAIKEERVTVSNGVLSIQEGVFSLADEALRGPVPRQQVQVIKIDEFHAIYYFIALDAADRTEGYVYVPDDLYPKEWDNTASWSEPLDINSKWWYICLYK